MLENKTTVEDKKVKDELIFDELFEKYKRLLKKDENIPLPLARNYRHSLACSSQPSIPHLKLEELSPNNKSRENEVRLPSSKNKIYENIKNDVPVIKSKNKSSVNVVGSIENKSGVSGIKNKTAQNIEGDSSLPNIAPNSTKSSSKLIKKFQSITKAEKAGSMINLMNSSGEKGQTKGKTINVSNNALNLNMINRLRLI